MGGSPHHELAALLPAAASSGALELAIGDRLAMLTAGDQLPELGYSGLGDFAREMVNVKPHRAYDLSSLARALWQTPLLRAAVHEGRVTTEKARLVVARASSADEAVWADLAAHGTIKEIRAALGPSAPEAEESWERIVLQASPGEAMVIGLGLEVAGIVSDRGPATPRPERVAAICMEYLGSYGPPASDGPPRAEGSGPGSQPGSWGALRDGAELARAMLGVEPGPATATELPLGLRAQAAALEEELRRSQHLTRLLPVADCARPPPAKVLCAELRQLGRLRAGWDELLGRVCRLARDSGIWRGEGFGSWGEYCEEKLGMTRRAAQNRISLDVRLDRLPELREALRSERLGYEQVRRIALVADGATVSGWIEKAAGLTVAELERLVDGERQEKISGAGEVELTLPDFTRELLQEALQVARERAGHWLPASTCLAEMCSHFLDHWAPKAHRLLRQMGHVRRRDGGMCQVPGCTRPGTQEHHIRFRSHGGGDEEDNLITLCKSHHLHGLHRGYIRVEGSATVLLTWWLGGRPVERPRVSTKPGPLDDLLEQLAFFKAA